MAKYYKSLCLLQPLKSTETFLKNPKQQLNGTTTSDETVKIEIEQSNNHVEFKYIILT